MLVKFHWRIYVARMLCFEIINFERIYLVGRCLLNDMLLYFKREFMSLKIVVFTKLV